MKLIDKLLAIVPDGETESVTVGLHWNGRFPFIADLRPQVGQLFVLEQNPGPGSLFVFWRSRSYTLEQMFFLKVASVRSRR
jgi:hypothetical protein